MERLAHRRWRNAEIIGKRRFRQAAHDKVSIELVIVKQGKPSAPAVGAGRRAKPRRALKPSLVPSKQPLHAGAKPNGKPIEDGDKRKAPDPAELRLRDLCVAVIAVHQRWRRRM